MSPNAIKLTLAAALLTAIAPAALAQTGANAPNALQGFQQNRSEPVQIEASRLEVRDKDKMATFTGNVKVVQGDTTMTSKTLVVFYDSTPAPSAPPQAQPRSGRNRHAPAW